MPAPFVVYAFFLTTDIFCLFLKHQVFLGVWIDNWVFGLVPLIFLSVFMLIPGSFQYCNFVVDFKVMDCDASRSSFIVQDCFTYLGLFAFLYEVEYCSFEICEEFYWDFDKYCTILTDCFW